MATRPRRSKSRIQVPDHPIVPGSILYQALQQVARAVAERLAEPRDVGRHDNDRLRSRRPAKAARD